MDSGFLQAAPELPMCPTRRQDAAEQDLFRMELVQLIDHRHELVSWLL
jgi:hypothetical protein